MIGKLKGIVDELGEDWVILDVHGVGYHVQCSARTLARLPQIGSPFTLSIETHVREDAIKLFGFETAEERDWFRLLQSVQGVGAKVALALLSIMTAADLANAIQFQDKAAINRAPRCGAAPGRAHFIGIEGQALTRRWSRHCVDNARKRPCVRCK